MIDEEFTVFAKRLFVSFPTLLEWLKSTSPDPAATQAIWRDTLRPYTLADCLGIIDDWNTGRQKPFEAYERDKVHLIVRAMIGLKLDRQRKRDEVRDRHRDFDKRIVLGDRSIPEQGLRQSRLMDATMVDVYKTLLPIYKKVLDGELSQSEYDRIKEVEFAKL